jgi:hypothetical protein
VFDMVFGYIDAGSGSMIVQALIAALATIPFFLRHQIARVVAVVRRTDEPEAQRRR